MNKIFIGLGVLAIGGLAYWYMTKPSGGDQPMMDAGTATPEEPTTGGTAKKAANVVGKSKKAVRRDCRAEAKSMGLKGKEKRQFKRECKASGGYDSEGAGFAFNGFDGAFEFAA